MAAVTLMAQTTRSCPLFLPFFLLLRKMPTLDLAVFLLLSVGNRAVSFSFW